MILHRRATGSSTRYGMTLIEMLVATTLTLVIMGVVVQLFGMVGDGVSASRASLRMSSELRSVGHTLRTDLNGITVQTLPPVRVNSDSGYLEIIEGPLSDYQFNNSNWLIPTLNGDTDDVLMFTTESQGNPFVGKLGPSGGVIGSPYAEVVWYCSPSSSQPLANADPPSTLYNLHRRQLLVLDYVGAGAFYGTNSLQNMIFPGATGEVPRNGVDDNGNNIIDEYFDITGEIPQNNLDDNNNGVVDEFNGPALLQLQADYDLSMRKVGSSAFPNGLADLSKRENRFLHNFSGIVSSNGFPYRVEPPPNFPTQGFQQTYSPGVLLGGNRLGEDIVLTNVLAFDVRVFDPTAEVLNNTAAGVAVIPGDPGYARGVQLSPRVYGAYIDMGVAGAGTFGMMARKSQLVDSQLTVPTYDTWSDHYEFNGIDEDGFEGVDQKVNSEDDPTIINPNRENNKPLPDPPIEKNGIIDDEEESETSPPYPVPLRGLEVRIRIYDASTRQVRQVTVRHTFVPH